MKLTLEAVALAIIAGMAWAIGEKIVNKVWP